MMPRLGIKGKAIKRGLFQYIVTINILIVTRVATRRFNKAKLICQHPMITPSRNAQNTKDQAASTLTTTNRYTLPHNHVIQR